MCCSSSLKKHKELGNVEEYRRRPVNTSRLFPFKIGKCPAPPSAQNWQKAVGPRYTIYCLERSGQKWSSWQADAFPSCNNIREVYAWTQMDPASRQWPKHTAKVIKNYLHPKELCVGLHEEREGFEEAYIYRRSVVSCTWCLEQPASRVPSNIVWKYA